MACKLAELKTQLSGESLVSLSRTVQSAALCIGVFLVLSRAHAQSPAATAAVTDYVKAEMQHEHVPGLSLLVIRDGKVLRAEGFGLSNVELQVPVKPETVFQSGSVGKQFTTTAVMMLVEEGKVGLDDPLTKYFSDAPAAWKDVTVRELLSHTAGFGDYPKSFDYRKDWTEAAQLKMLEATPLLFAPGTKWEYSNFGYMTLGILIHRITGEFYGDFLEQRIFQPLGMTSTRIISEADIVPQRAAGPIPVPITRLRYIEPGIIRKPMKSAPTIDFHPKPSSNFSGGLSKSRYS